MLQQLLKAEGNAAMIYALSMVTVVICLFAMPEWMIAHGVRFVAGVVTVAYLFEKYGERLMSTLKGDARETDGKPQQGTAGGKDQDGIQES